jgi:hypothetical protein
VASAPPNDREPDAYLKAAVSGTTQWALLDSNQRPPACKESARRDRCRLVVDCVDQVPGGVEDRVRHLRSHDIGASIVPSTP